MRFAFLELSVWVDFHLVDSFFCLLPSRLWFPTDCRHLQLLLKPEKEGHRRCDKKILSLFINDKEILTDQTKMFDPLNLSENDKQNNTNIYR